MSSDIMVKYALRPCVIKLEQKALFHRWVDNAQVIPPSPYRGGHSGGQTWAVLGLVEFEDGVVSLCAPDDIIFLDLPHQEYDWRKFERQEESYE